MRKSPVSRAIGYFAFLCLTYSQTSCLEVEEKPVNFGPEVTAAEVIGTLREGMGKLEHTQIGKGEKSEGTSYLYATNNPDDRFIFRVEQRVVVDKQTLNDRIRYVSKLTTTTYDNGQATTKEVNVADDFPLSADYDAETPIAEQAMVSALQKSGIKTSGLNAPKVTFHQLQVREDIRDLPSKVKNKTNCANVPECKLKVRVVNVVAAEWLPSGPVRHDLGFIVSPDAPFFSRLMANCDTSYQKFDKQAVLVSVCAQTTDFDFGTNW
jgi:hypothetical protein